MSKYSESLKDPRWQKKRLEVLQRDDFSCTRCTEKEKTLIVHHCRYDGKMAHETNTDNLITLCEECHNDHHNEQKEHEEKFLKNFYSAGFLSDDLDIIALSIEDYNPTNLPALPGQISAAIYYHLSDSDRITKLVDEWIIGNKKRLDEKIENTRIQNLLKQQ